MSEKKKISAIICELNPLHKGHQALFRQVKKDSKALVCILSGNFVQRGEPAILDKWSRTRLALENGADLVIELPLPWACAGAERFAAGGIHLACALGNVTELAFGSEEPDEKKLRHIAKVLLSPRFSQAFQGRDGREGESFAAARSRVISSLLGPEYGGILEQPNCILGIEYEKALLREGSPLLVHVFPRIGAGHDEAAGEREFWSAGKLRQAILEGKNLSGLVPQSTQREMNLQKAAGAFPASATGLERALLCKLRTMEPRDFSSLPDLSEGLENRLYQASRQAGTLEELYALVKTKRYSHARIRRLVFSAFLGITGSLPALPPYLRVLGMTKEGEQLLKSASPTLPLALRYADFQKLGGRALDLFHLESRADDLYAMAAPVPRPCGRDFTEKLIKL